MESESLERLKSAPLYAQAKLKIIELIKDGVFPDNKLSAEKELSERLGVSRATIREALMALSREGVISKKQGLGTLYHLSSLKARMRIDKFNSFVELLSDGGYEVSVRRLGQRWVKPSEEEGVPEIFQKEEQCLQSEVLHLADNQPAIYSRMVIPQSILTVNFNEGAQRSPANSPSALLNAYSREEVSHSISRFKPISVNEENGEIFGLEKGTAAISWNEIYYSIMDRILCHTRVIFHPELMDFSILRKWD